MEDLNLKTSIFNRDFWQQKHKAGDFSSFFFFFSFLRGRDVGRSNFIVFVFVFFTFLSFKINLQIHITFTLWYKKKPYVLSKHFRQIPIIFSVLWQCTWRRGRWLLLFRYSCDDFRWNFRTEPKNTKGYAQRYLKHAIACVFF